MTDCTSLTPIAGRVAKLLKQMLSTEHDGEAIAAKEAIKRTLASAGADIHILADAIEAGPTFLQEALVRADEARRQAEEELKRARDIAKDMRTRPWHEDQSPPWNAIAHTCEAASHRLGERERKFVEDMVRWTACGGEPTEKQAKWLRSIYVRVGGT
jgi:hypothetical protein